MAQYRFVGSSLQHPDFELSRFGETITLAESLASELIQAGAALLPEALWQKTGITEDECAQWFSTTLHGEAPADFLEKRTLAWKLLHDYRQSLLTPDKEN